MSLKLAIGLVLCAGQPAFAERSIVVEVPALAPFDADELRSALRVRLAPDGAPVAIRVLAIPNGVRIEVRDGSRAVVLDGLSGPAAARMVALAANDLILDDLAMPPVDAARPPALMPETSGQTRVAVLGAVAAWDSPFGGATGDVTRSWKRWVVAFDLGAATLVGGPIGLDAAILRISAGVQLSWFELRGGPVFAPVFVSSGDGDRTVLAGGGASVRARVPLGDGLRAVVAAGTDVFATRTQYLIEGMPTLTTPRFSPWFGAGLEVTP